MAKTLSRIVPCVWLDDQAEPAAAFYARTFPAGRVIAASHYPVQSTTRAACRAAAS